VIVATGAEAVWLNVPGEKEFLGKGVSTCAGCDAAFFRNKTTVVVGGGDAAMEDALQLTKFAQKVIVVHRRDSFRASKVMAERVLNHPKISVMWNSKIDRIEGDGLLRQVVISNEATGKNNLLKVDGLFIAIGHKPTTEFVNGFLELNDGYIKVGITNFPITPQQIQVHDMWKKGYPTMTSKEGVFAAGDCVDFRYRQAAVAAGMGIMAALDAQWWLEE